jgi:hypothetical protein
MKAISNNVPFFSQWESRDITSDVLHRGASIALAEDPSWLHPAQLISTNTSTGQPIFAVWRASR